MANCKNDTEWKQYYQDENAILRAKLAAAEEKAKNARREALEEAAMTGVDEILRDFTDRRGLRQEWDRIDMDIQQEIIKTWRDLIRALAGKE